MKKISSLLAAAALIAAVISGCSQNQPVVSVTGVVLDKTEAVLGSGETLQLNADVVPADAGVRDLRWSSAGGAVASVSDGGLVTAVSDSGTAVITVSTVDGGFQACCAVTVSKNPGGIVNVASVSISEQDLSLRKGTSAQLTAAVLPEKADNTAIMWLSSDESIVTVDAAGRVSASGIGTAVITAVSADGSFRDGCNVTVTPDKIVIFLTENRYGGNLGGRMGADKKVASDPGCPDGLTDVHAYISVNETDCLLNMPANFGFPADIPVVGVNGTELSPDWNSLFGEGGGPGSSNLPSAASAVFGSEWKDWWTGSYTLGTCRGNAYTCNGWTDDSVSGYFGNSAQRDMYYFYGDNSTVGTNARFVIGIGY